MRKYFCMVIAVLIMLTIFTGCRTDKQRDDLGNNNDEAAYPSSSIHTTEQEAANFDGKILVTVYLANENNTLLKKVRRYISSGEARGSTEALATALVQELISGPAEGDSTKPTIPEGTTLKNTVKVEAGLATVNFSKEFIQKHPGGKAMEQLTIFSVVNTLTELIDVQRVQFRIEDKVEKEFKGSFVLDAPFPRTVSFIESNVQTTESSVAADESISAIDEIDNETGANLEGDNIESSQSGLNTEGTEAVIDPEETGSNLEPEETGSNLDPEETGSIIDNEEADEQYFEILD